MVEMLAGHASGLTLQQVARKLYVSDSCVYNTVQAMKDKTGGTTLAQMCVMAHSANIIVDVSQQEGVYVPVVDLDWSAAA